MIDKNWIDVALGAADEKNIHESQENLINIFSL
jgi:hypothetical protein